MPDTSRRRSTSGSGLQLRYVFLLLVYLLGIYWLSSLPDTGVRGEGLSLPRFSDGEENPPLIRLALNLSHIPLFAGLAFCLLRVLSGGAGRQQVTWKLAGLTFLGTAVLAALDEWHQAFVPGRQASLKDFLFDLVGIGVMLVILHLRARRRMHRPRPYEDLPSDAGEPAPPGDRPHAHPEAVRSAAGR